MNIFATESTFCLALQCRFRSACGPWTYVSAMSGGDVDRPGFAADLKIGSRPAGPIFSRGFTGSKKNANQK